jgi:hypothetical protein
MKNVLFCVALACVGLLGVGGASAMPVGAGPDASVVTLASGGCGPYAHPNRFGRCEPNMRRYYAPRCYVRATPYGPRRFCR